MSREPVTALTRLLETLNEQRHTLDAAEILGACALRIDPVQEAALSQVLRAKRYLIERAAALSRNFEEAMPALARSLDSGGSGNPGPATE